MAVNTSGDHRKMVQSPVWLDDKQDYNTTFEQQETCILHKKGYIGLNTTLSGSFLALKYLYLHCLSCWAPTPDHNLVVIDPLFLQYLTVDCRERLGTEWNNKLQQVWKRNTFSPYFFSLPVISNLVSNEDWKNSCSCAVVSVTHTDKCINNFKHEVVIANNQNGKSVEGEGVSYNKRTEISFDRILELGRRRFIKDSEIYSETNPYCGYPLLTMSCLGELGRFGNQVFQYMFLKCCALVHHTAVQVPPWIGKSLFELEDDCISVKLPIAVESSRMKANSIFADKLTAYLNSISAKEEVVEVEPEVLKGTGEKLVNRDVWGWFQWHTSYYRPFRSYIYSLFRVKPELKEYLDTEISNKLCPLDGSFTLVGIHIRLGDYKDIAASSFAYCAPVSWYLEWLENIWPQLKNPVLFVASDEIEKVKGYFWRYQPKTCDSLGIHMPTSWASTGADFFPDWYILTLCDVLAISNSTFSFTSCLLNQRKKARFYRAHYLHRMIEMDPWNTDPVIHKEWSGSFWKRSWETIVMLYRQQGTMGLLRNIFWGFPLYRIRSLLIRLVLSLRRLYWNSFLKWWFE